VDEIEELVRIKGAIDELKPEFDQVSLVISYTCDLIVGLFLGKDCKECVDWSVILHCLPS
jgi:hypothetical protein